MVDAIHVKLATSVCDRCPVGTLSERTPLREVRVDPIDERVDFVTDDYPADRSDAVELLEFAGEAHGRYVFDDEGHDRSASDGNTGQSSSEHDDGDACACSAFLPAFSDFPVPSRETRIDDGELITTFVLTGYDELQSIINALGSAEIRQILIERDGSDDQSNIVPIDLSEVTERQATVAAVAVQEGYFEPNGATADEVAAHLDLAKSTVSEHLRTVTATVLSQLFGDST